MSSSFRKTNWYFLIAGAILLAGIPVAQAAGNRMAGSAATPASAPEPAPVPAQLPPQDVAVAAEPAAAEPVASVLPVDFAVLESYGILHTAREGALGIDLWDNTSRGELASLISEQPGLTPYRTLNRITRRALLTTADARLMTGRNGIEPGQDLLVLRLEKLLEGGAYDEAARLYTANPAEPYHERLARAGILALLYSGRTPVACLETFALEKRFAHLPFWNDLLAACTYLMTGDRENPAAAALDSYRPQSKLVEKFIKNPGFRYAVKKAQDLESLGDLEKALLVATGRIDYSDFKITRTAGLDPGTAAMLLQDGNLPAGTRFALLRFAVASGIRDAGALADFYRSISFANLTTATSRHIDYPDIKGWRRLAWFFQSAESAPPHLRDDLMARVLLLGGEYGVTAILPFASYIKEASPDGLPAESIRTALRAMLVADVAIASSWRERWQTVKTGAPEDLILETAYNAHEEFSTSLENPDFNLENTGLDPHQTQIIQAVYEKLDNFQKISEDSRVGAYEKPSELTLNGDYVMPSGSLVDSLNEAESDRRLGEMVLISSLALQSAPPGKLYPGLLREVLEGLRTVGLTEEARNLAKEVVLGL